ncbi:MAG: hypothetical protein WBP48_05820, partial [Microbacterium sp.]
DADPTRDVAAPDAKRHHASAHAPEFSRRALQELMWADAGLVRDTAGLEHAASVIAAWRAQSRAAASEAEREDENLLRVAERLVAAALARTASVGAHFRRDAAVSQKQAEPGLEAPREALHSRSSLLSEHEAPLRGPATAADRAEPAVAAC